MIFYLRFIDIINKLLLLKFIKMPLIELKPKKNNIYNKLIFIKVNQ